MATKKAASSKKSDKTVSVSAKISPASLKKFSAPLKENAFIGSLLAEVFGTFLLTIMVIASQGQPIILLFALIGIVVLVGNLSGAHVNPAMTIAAWVTKKITGLRAIVYVAAQFAGAALAFGLLTYFVNGAPAVSAEAAAYGQTGPSLYHALTIPKDKEVYLAVAEVVGALILGFGYANAIAAKKDRIVSSLSVGFAVFISLFLAASAANYVSGTAVLNPAVAMSVDALKVEAWPLAIYFLSPVLGGVLGFALFDVLNKNHDGGSGL